MSKRRIDGMDLSHYQTSTINYNAAKRAGVRFIYHKATEGTGYSDPSYSPRRAGARGAKIPFGAYHFARPRVGSAVAEAKFFLSVAKPQPGDMAPALDLEVNDHGMSPAQLTTWVRTFHAVVAAATGSNQMLLYTPFDLNGPRIPGVRLWAARYSNGNVPPIVRSPFWTWAIWQFSDGRFGNPNRVPGVPEPVDIDSLHRMFPFARVNALRLPARRRRVERVRPAPAPAVPRAGALAIRRARLAGRGPVGMCLSRVVDAYGFNHNCPDAITAWNRGVQHAETNPAKIPAGYPVFWRGGSSGHGHIAISLGNGQCISTDIIREGYFSVVPISLIHQKWGLTLLGYTTTLNGSEIR